MKLLRHLFTLMVLNLLAAGSVFAATDLVVAVTPLRVMTQPHARDIDCPKPPPRARSGRPAEPDPLEFPDAAEIDALLAARQTPAVLRPNGAMPLIRRHADGPFRVGIWGDSHLAAGFFTDELIKLSGVERTRARAVFIPANMNRPGVRLPLRASCVSPQWRTELAYTKAGSSAQPGPGLVNLYSSEAGASLAFDVRTRSGVAETSQVQVLYEATGKPLRVLVSVDDRPGQELSLSGAKGPAALELGGDAPISVVRVQLLEGQFRFHGLRLSPPEKLALQLDVFGFPGATVAGWQSAPTDYLTAWFRDTPYDLVVLQYGTNEGNALPFDAEGYRRLLRSAVDGLRAAFPRAACLLITPGDRGVLVRRSLKSGHGDFTASRESGGGAAPSRASRLLTYSRVHEQINQIQQDVAAAGGCQTWSTFDAMGGEGSAYEWAREKPALMAPDLIHFTVRGYQRLAQDFARSIGWNARSDK